MTRIRVLVVDDQALFREGLRAVLSADPELDVIGEAGSVSQALAQIPALQPDVAVLDVRLPDGNGIELCRDLLSKMPARRAQTAEEIAAIVAMLAANESITGQIIAADGGRLLR